MNDEQKIIMIIEESNVLTIHHLEQMRKAINDIVIAVHVPFGSVADAFRSASFSTDDFKEGLSRFADLNGAIEDDKPARKPYHKFIPETIGRKRRC